MTAPSSQDPEPPEADPRRLAAERLGPRSEALFAADPAGMEVRARVARRTREGTDLEDAVLTEVHRAACDDRELANEFIGFFLADLMHIGGATLSRGLHQFVDTGDLVQSVLGDLWPVLAEVRFQTRGQFLAFLSRRLDWKAVSKARKLRSERERREPVGQAPEPRSTERSPLSELASEESYDRTILKILRLSERDQRLLTLYLNEEPIDRIAAELELSRASAHKALQRAIARFRELK